MARLNPTRKRGIQLGTHQQEAPYFPIVKYIHPDKRLDPDRSVLMRCTEKVSAFASRFSIPVQQRVF